MARTLTSKEIIQTIEKHKKELWLFKVKKIGLFGSAAKGTAKRGSDLDFLAVFKKPTFDNYMNLKFFLEKIFRKRVDLVTEKSLKPALRYVKKEAIYAKVA